VAPNMIIRSTVYWALEPCLSFTDDDLREKPAQIFARRLDFVSARNGRVLLETGKSVGTSATLV
jgi:hypothetical protein